MQKYILIFLTMLFGFFGIYSASTDITTAAAVKNRQYTEYLSSAAYDAAKEMKKNADGTSTLPTENDRGRVVHTFFNSLEMNFGYDTEEESNMLKMYVPVVALIDTNGFYICHNVRSLDKTKSDNPYRLVSSITDISTWGKSVSDDTDTYLIRYYLSDKVDVTKASDNKTVSGDYAEVYQELGSPQALKDAGFDDNKLFTTIKNETIIPEIQEEIEYYINRQNDVTSVFQPNYTFEMPMTREDDWARLLENPTCIAFLQGIRVSNTKRYLNIYSLGGGEVRKNSEVVFANANNASGTVSNYFEGKEVQTEKGEDGTTKYYVVIQNADGTETKKYINGYTPNIDTVAKAGAEITYSERQQSNDEYSSNEKVYPHRHWGNPYDSDSSNDGCYVPYYHVHSVDCYTVNGHQHKDSTGTVQSSSYHAPTSGGCFTKPVTHVHNSSCYSYTWHVHSGDPVNGGGCFTTYIGDDSSKTIYSEYGVNTYYTADGTAIPGTAVVHYKPSCGRWDATNWNTTTRKNEPVADLTTLRINREEQVNHCTRIPKSEKVYINNISEETQADGITVKKQLGFSMANILNMETESIHLTCSKTEGATVDYYTVNCGKSEGIAEATGTTQTCGKISWDDAMEQAASAGLSGNDATTYAKAHASVDHYELGCGYSQGQLLTKAEADAANEH